MTRWTGALTTLLCVNMLAGVSSAEATAAPLTLRQVVRKGAPNSILGIRASAAFRIASQADSTLTLAGRLSDPLDLEPLVALPGLRRIESTWALHWPLSHRNFGGYYRVVRLPGITLTRRGKVGRLGHGLRAAVGSSRSRRRVSTVRSIRRRWLATPALSIEPALATLLFCARVPGDAERLQSTSGKLD